MAMAATEGMWYLSVENIWNAFEVVGSSPSLSVSLGNVKAR